MKLTRLWRGLGWLVFAAVLSATYLMYQKPEMALVLDAGFTCQ